MALLNDGSLPSLYDFAIDGVGYLVAWEEHQPPFRFAYTEEYPDLVVERRDSQNVEQMSENKLDYFMWRSQRSWEGGAGQQRFDAPSSAQNAFLSSQGVDVSMPGQITLLPLSVSQSLLSSGTIPNNRHITTGDSSVFVSDNASGTNNARLQKFVVGSTSFAFTISNTGATIYGLASNGHRIFIAMGANGMDSDFATSSGSTQFSTADVRSVTWCKQQCLAAGIKSGTQWRLMSFPITTPPVTPTELLVLPDGFTVPQNGIAEAGGFAYFACNNNDVAYIYSWDGVSTFGIAAQLPAGEQVTSIHGLLGKYLMVATATLGHSGNYTDCHLYQGTITSAGVLNLTNVYHWNTGLEYTIDGMEEVGGRLFFGWPDIVSGYASLAVFDPKYTSVARHLEVPGNPSAPRIGELCSSQGLLVYIDYHDTGQPVYYQSTSQYCAVGTVVGSIFDWNIDANKNVLRAEAAYEPLPANTEVDLEYSTNGTSFTVVTTDASTGSTSAAAQLGIAAKRINYELVLKSLSGQTATPIVKKAGLASWYRDRARGTHIIAVKADDRMQLKNATDYPGSGPQLGENIYATLRTLQQNQTLVDFQPPGWGAATSDGQHNRSMKVNVRALKTFKKWTPGVGFGMVIQATLVEVPS